MKFAVTLLVLSVLAIPSIALSQNTTPELVSVNSEGSVSGNGHSYGPVISDDGRYVAFLSEASDLDPTVTDTNGLPDVYVRDLETGVTRLASFDETGSSAPYFGVYEVQPAPPVLLSADGRYVVYSSRASVGGLGSNSRRQVIISDMVTKTLIPVSVSYEGDSWGNNDANALQVSPDGRYVLFRSFASNLVSRDTNNKFDLFVRDMQEGVTSLVTINASGSDSANDGLARSNDPLPAMTPDGRFVAFYSMATNLVPNIPDNAGTVDAFVRDLVEQKTTLVSVNYSGTHTGDQRPENWYSGEYIGPSITSDGRFVAFFSGANDIVEGTFGRQIYLRDLVTNITVKVQKHYDGSTSPFGISRNPQFTKNDRFLVYQSSDRFIVQEHQQESLEDIYIYDMELETNQRFPAQDLGFLNWSPVASYDGRYISASSPADLLPNDSNGVWDVYMHDVEASTTSLLSTDLSGLVSGADHSPPYDAVVYQRRGYDITENGQYVAFASAAENLVANDANGSWDVFVVRAFDNLPPVADAGPDRVGVAGEPIDFDGTGSSDPNDTIVSYTWDFGDGNQGTGAIASHVYSSVGVYTVTLTITDEYDASASDEAVVTMLARPIADAGPDIRVLVTIEAILDGTASYDPDGEIVTYAWDFGDGDTDAGAIVAHWWAPPDTYTATLTVTDNDSLTATDTTTVVVTTPSEAAIDLAAAVDQLAVDGKLTEQRAWSLRNLVLEAKNRIDNGSLSAAEGKLRDFIKRLKNLVKTGKLDQPDADPLIQAAEDIIQVISS